MQTLEQLQEEVRIAFENEKFIFEPKELYEPIEYTMQQTGKRIRPLLALLSCNMFGKDIDEVLNPAIGIEIFHNFTLLHDDIMDNSFLRRGKETVFKKWNTNTAILSGDTMFALAYHYIGKNKSPHLHEILDVFTQTAIEVCEGQQYDMNFETRTNVSIPDYIKMIRLKTAVLLACSLAIGAIVAEASKEDVQHIYDFGIDLGLAFQLQDDYLDSYGNTEVFGKKTGTDIVDNKKTFLCLKAIEKATGKEKEILEKYFSHKDFNADEKINAVRTVYDNLNIKDETIKEINKYYQSALFHLEAISVNDKRKTELQKLAKSLLGREY